MGGPTVMPLPCLCASVRRAARVMSQLYDDSIRPTGVRGAQFTLLQALSGAGPLTQRDLGQALAIDATTLSRTLRTVEAAGWITRVPGADRRERRLAVTDSGIERLAASQAVWKDLQDRLRQQLGDDRWADLMAACDAVTGMALKASEATA
jgi:DNA-binding MarR family transcriptional regulator